MKRQDCFINDILIRNEKMKRMILIVCCLYGDSSKKEKYLPKYLYVWSCQSYEDEPLAIGNSFLIFFFSDNQETESV